jgi:hypothetical protein
MHELKFINKCIKNKDDHHIQEKKSNNRNEIIDVFLASGTENIDLIDVYERDDQEEYVVTIMQREASAFGNESDNLNNSEHNNTAKYDRLRKAQPIMPVTRIQGRKVYGIYR